MLLWGLLVLGLWVMRVGVAEPLPQLPKGEAEPYRQPVFAVPEALHEDMADYRHRFNRVSAISYSALHWNHFVSIFAAPNGAATVYRNNFKEYMTLVEREDDGDDYEPSFQQYPVGTVFVKEHFISEGGHAGNPTQLSVMKKHAAGYDFSGGDWEYIQIGFSGKVMARGNSENPVVKALCSNCHSNIANRDYVFSLNYQEIR
ncbi:MAG: cytochrome P460 family protein [Gammaproteobacteria bacterium]